MNNKITEHLHVNGYVESALRQLRRGGGVVTHLLLLFVMLLTATSPSRAQNVGEGIIYTSGATADILALRPDGAKRKNLTHSCRDEFSPLYSPDGTKIAYRNDRATYSELYVMNADGSNQRLIYTPNVRPVTGFSDFSSFGAVSWSPDSRKLVFSDDNPDASGVHVYTINVDGTGVTKLTPGTNGRYASPSWSPDGSTIIYINNGLLYMMNADGSNPREIRFQDCGNGVQVTPPSYCTLDFSFSPTPFKWSPDGTKISFRYHAGTCFSNCVPDGFYTMNTDGTGLKTVRLGNTVHAEWSPDSSKFLFTYDQKVSVMNADGSGFTQLTAVQSAHGAWSPDGARIAYAAVVGGKYQVHVMKADGSEQTRISFTQQDEFVNTWRPEVAYSCNCPTVEAVSPRGGQ